MGSFGRWRAHDIRGAAGGEQAQRAALDRTEDGRGQGTVLPERSEAWLHRTSSRRPPVRPFADNPTELQEFIQAVLAELAPVTAQERAEALNIVGLYVRRSRLVELEAMALAHATRTRTLPPDDPGGPPRVAEEDLMRAGATALGADLFDRLPRYEGHLNRELDKSLARYARMRDARLQQEDAIAGELVPPVRLAAQAQ